MHMELTAWAQGSLKKFTWCYSQARTSVFIKKNPQLEIAYLAISKLSWSRTQIILPGAYFVFNH